MARTVVVGDSLGVGTVPHLHGNVKADVKVGRSSADGLRALARLVDGADRIVLDLGTNDGSAEQLAQSVRRAVMLAKGKPIYIATVNGPNAAAKNKVIRSMAGNSVHVVDWAGQSKGLVGSDGIHATASGYAKRAQMIRNAMGGGEPPTRETATEPTSAPTRTNDTDRLRQLAQAFIGQSGYSGGQLTPQHPARLSKSDLVRMGIRRMDTNRR